MAQSFPPTFNVTVDPLCEAWSQSRRGTTFSAQPPALLPGNRLTLSQVSRDHEPLPPPLPDSPISERCGCHVIPGAGPGERPSPTRSAEGFAEAASPPLRTRSRAALPPGAPGRRRGGRGGTTHGRCSHSCRLLQHLPLSIAASTSSSRGVRPGPALG
ncbi:Hypothetical predicted protein [Marmota monax]|uniref:Uncharacterized protein n=1 Tax=Marmota monax TaxID=9995 RepID=A0A5E4B4S8_MARMO|nr:hypothetical protein GHT09_000851 [Marmota monax]VTJ64106.1 Hypothetical predicted protein [Marmota monax]